MFQLPPPGPQANAGAISATIVITSQKNPLNGQAHVSREEEGCMLLTRSVPRSWANFVRLRFRSKAGESDVEECFHLGFLIADVGPGPVLQTFPSGEITMVCEVLPNFQARPKDQLKILKLVGACLNQAGPISSRCRTASLHRGHWIRSRFGKRRS